MDSVFTCNFEFFLVFIQTSQKPQNFILEKLFLETKLLELLLKMAKNADSNLVD